MSTCTPYTLEKGGGIFMYFLFVWQLGSKVGMCNQL